MACFQYIHNLQQHLQYSICLLAHHRYTLCFVNLMVQLYRDCLNQPPLLEPAYLQYFLPQLIFFLHIQMENKVACRLLVMQQKLHACCIDSRYPYKLVFQIPDLLLVKREWYHQCHLLIKYQYRWQILFFHLHHHPLLLLPNAMDNIHQTPCSWSAPTNDKLAPSLVGCSTSYLIRCCGKLHHVLCVKIPSHSPPYQLHYHHTCS